MEENKVLLIDGWYDLHKTHKNHIDKNDTVNVLWEISMNNFMNMLFPNYEGKNIYRAEAYREYFYNDFHNFSEYIYSEVQRNEINGKLKEYVRILISKSKTKELSEHLAGLLKSYVGDVVSTEVLRKEIEKLSDCKDISIWIKNLFYYIYYAVTGRMHKELGYGKYPDLEKDLEEYKDNVVMGYGCSGVPGMSKIYALANREKPNIIALYELGEMEYYGRGPSGVINYEKAYDYYCQTLELNNAHPLALWSIAYMKFNYKRVKNELENASILELDDELPTETETNYGKRKHRKWCEDIINKVTQSYGYGCAAAANLIGKILSASEEEFPSAYRGIFNGRNAMEFFKESADKNYSFGCNNYALGCLKIAEKTENVVNVRYYSEEAIKYLKRSAMEGEVWAANKLGRLYLDGFEIKGCRILTKNEDEAYKYFQQAESFFGVRKYYWSLINMCKYMYCNDKSKYYKYVSADILLEKLKIALEVLSESEADQIVEIKKNIEIISKWTE